MAKIAIVEDQTLLLTLLSELCERDFGHTVVFGAQTRADLLQKLPASGIEVLLLDVNLPDGDGIDIAREVKQIAPTCAIIAVSGETTPYTLHRAIEARIDGFVEKDAAPQTLREAIAAVVRREPFFTEFVTQTSRLHFSASDCFTKVLSNAEIVLMPLFGQGLHNDEIAKRRNLSASTVQTHRRNVMAKLQLHTSIDLMRYAIKAGFVMVRTG